jgi:hypothetical protein
VEIITQEHERWPEFLRRLRNKMAEWDCFHDHRFTFVVLREMANRDPFLSASEFIDRGWYCECEILRANKTEQT